MDWHYSDNGQQTGPVTEEQLVQLVHTGTVKPETLIWRSGMTGWKPFSEAGPGVPPPLPGGAQNRVCASCSRMFATTDLAVYGESAICADCKPAWAQRLRQGMTSTAPGNLHYAGFWIRVGAHLIDGIILSVVLGAVFFLFFGAPFVAIMQQAAAAGARGGQPDPGEMAALMAPIMASIGLFQLLGLVVSLGYSAGFWLKFGATPGKMAVGIKVVRADGSPISVGQAIGRFFGYILSSLILYIGYMMAGWDEQKRALHDRLAETRVIYKQS